MYGLGLKTWPTFKNHTEAKTGDHHKQVDVNQSEIRAMTDAHIFMGIGDGQHDTPLTPIHLKLYRCFVGILVNVVAYDVLR